MNLSEGVSASVLVSEPLGQACLMSWKSNWKCDNLYKLWEQMFMRKSMHKFVFGATKKR